MAASLDFRGHEPGVLVAVIPEFLVTASIIPPEKSGGYVPVILPKSPSKRELFRAFCGRLNSPIG